MRHPLAVIASSLAHPAFQGKAVSHTHPVISDKLEKTYPELCEYALSLKNIEEKLTATWCFDYKIALQRKNKNLHLITYENFVDKPTTEINKLSDFLQIDFPESTYQLVKKPSATVVQAKKDSSIEQLSKWKQKLAPIQIERMLKVLENFAIDFYTDDIYPDLTKI